METLYINSSSSCFSSSLMSLREYAEQIREKSTFKSDLSSHTCV